MNADWYFRDYPIGTLVYDRLSCVIGYICTHLESKWLGSKQPWYGVAYNILIPEDHEQLHSYENYFDHRTVLAGERPHQPWSLHCLNGGADNSILIPLDKFFRLKIPGAEGIGYGPWHGGSWVLHTDSGDPSVGLGGGEVLQGFGTLDCYAARGTPDLAVAKYTEHPRVHKWVDSNGIERSMDITDYELDEGAKQVWDLYYFIDAYLSGGRYDECFEYEDVATG